MNVSDEISKLQVN